MRDLGTNLETGAAGSEMRAGWVLCFLEKRLGSGYCVVFAFCASCFPC